MTQPSSDGATRVFLRTGRVAHLLSPADSVNHGYPPARCGARPDLFYSWYGTGSQEEYELAAELPTCRNCKR